MQNLLKYHIVIKPKGELSKLFLCLIWCILWGGNVTCLSDIPWKTAKLPMQCYKSSQRVLWPFFGLFLFLLQHRKYFLQTLHSVTELTAVLSCSWACLRKIFREKSEVKCSYVRSCCFSWKRKCRCCWTLVTCLEYVILCIPSDIFCIFLMCTRPMTAAIVSG